MLARQHTKTLVFNHSSPNQSSTRSCECFAAEKKLAVYSQVLYTKVPSVNIGQINVWIVLLGLQEQLQIYQSAFAHLFAWWITDKTLRTYILWETGLQRIPPHCSASIAWQIKMKQQCILFVPSFLCLGLVPLPARFECVSRTLFHMNMDYCVWLHVFSSCCIAK